MTSLDQSLLARLHADLGSLLNGNAPPPVVVNHHNNRAKETQENAERLRKLQMIVDAMNNNKSEATSSSSIDSSAKPKRSVAEIDANRPRRVPRSSLTWVPGIPPWRAAGVLTERRAHTPNNACF